MNNRPFGVALISILLGIEGILQIIAGLVLMGIMTFAFFAADSSVSAGLLMFIGVVALIAGIIELIVAAGMWNLKRWTWILAVLILWIDLILDLVSGFTLTQTWGSVIVSMIIPLIVLIYLYQGGVKNAFK